MGIGAWIMLIFGAAVLYGGLVWCLLITTRKKPAESEADQFEKPPEAA